MLPPWLGNVASCRRICTGKTAEIIEATKYMYNRELQLLYCMAASRIFRLRISSFPHPHPHLDL
jgi:hypothetical protein